MFRRAFVHPPKVSGWILGFILGVFTLFVSASCQRFGCQVPSQSDSVSSTSTSAHRPPVIDAHTHISPLAVERALRIMKENGIVALVNLSGGVVGEEFELRSRFYKKAGRRILSAANLDWRWLAFPEEFGKVNAMLLEEAVATGAVALKIFKSLGLSLPDPTKVNLHTYIDSQLHQTVFDWQEPQRPEEFLPVDTPLLNPVWEKCAELGIPVYIHTADPKAFFLPPTPENERYEELKVHPNWSFADKRYYRWEELLAQLEHTIKTHPKTTFIAVHFGCAAEEPSRVARMLDSYPNLVIDIAARIPEFGRHDAKTMRNFFLKYQDRILFGTDLGVSTKNLMLGSSDGKPKTEQDARTFFEAHWKYFETNHKQIDHPTPIQGNWKVDAIGLPKSVLEKLYYKNALRLFPAFQKVLAQ